MEQWEYLTEFLYANLEAKGAKDYIHERWPDWKPDKYAPEAMIPALNALGADGWELVHMQPVGVGRNSDIMVGYAANNMKDFWSNIYFCVFKRRKSAV